MQYLRVFITVVFLKFWAHWLILYVPHTKKVLCIVNVTVGTASMLVCDCLSINTSHLRSDDKEKLP